VLGEKTGLGRTWIGVVPLAATTSLPELFTGFGATALAPLPDIALGDVLGSCMFNLLILSLMDASGAVPTLSRYVRIAEAHARRVSATPDARRAGVNRGTGDQLTTADDKPGAHSTAAARHPHVTRRG
jgi:hypothetical protein